MIQWSDSVNKKLNKEYIVENKASIMYSISMLHDGATNCIL